MYIELKSYGLKFLGKLVVQHDIRTWFNGKSWVQAYEIFGISLEKLIVHGTSFTKHKFIFCVPHINPGFWT